MKLLIVALLLVGARVHAEELAAPAEDLDAIYTTALSRAQKPWREEVTKIDDKTYRVQILRLAPPQVEAKVGVRVAVKTDKGWTDLVSDPQAAIAEETGKPLKIGFHKISADKTALLIETVGEDCSIDCKHSMQIFELQPKPVYRGSVLTAFDNEIECKLHKKDANSRPCFAWTGTVKYGAASEAGQYFPLQVDRKGTQLKFSESQEIAGVGKTAPLKYEFSDNKYQCVDGCL